MSVHTVSRKMTLQRPRHMSMSIWRRARVELVASKMATCPPRCSIQASMSSSASLATAVRDASAASLEGSKNSALHLRPTKSRRYLPTLKWRVSWPSHVR
jgi:hypothetical protein